MAELIFPHLFDDDEQDDRPVVTTGAKCRECGCDELHACVTAEGPCRWVAPDLCSACAPLVLSANEADLDEMIRMIREDAAHG